MIKIPNIGFYKEKTHFPINYRDVKIIERVQINHNKDTRKYYTT